MKNSIHVAHDHPFTGPSAPSFIRVPDPADRPAPTLSLLRSEPVAEKRPLPKWGWQEISWLATTLLVLVAAAVAMVTLQPEFEQWHAEQLSTQIGFAIVAVSLGLLIFRGLFFLYQVVLFVRYRPIKSVKDDELPTCTVIVPAYNEGRQVWETFLSLAASNYPAEKLQIIGIDDGSQDDTWYWMQRAQAQLGKRLSIFQQPRNQGKRHALYRGFRLATGDVWVTVDSDSVVLADTLRNLVTPFVVKPNCGAVAGNVRVLNTQGGIIPRMLNVSFTLSFEFVRSAQSMLGSVLCTPGALAAYHRKAVMPCLDEWLHQTFMGKPSDIGEDRAITNLVLRQGYDVLFQQNAHVLTTVPERYPGLSKMYIRWERSNVRENVLMARFIGKNFRAGSKWGTRLLFVNQWLRTLTAYPFTLLMFVLLSTHTVLFLSSTLSLLFVYASFSVLFHARRYGTAESLWAYCYSLFHTFLLFWISPYAIATAGKSGWLTRELPAKDVYLSQEPTYHLTKTG